MSHIGTLGPEVSIKPMPAPSVDGAAPGPVNALTSVSAASAVTLKNVLARMLTLCTCRAFGLWSLPQAPGHALDIRRLAPCTRACTIEFHMAVFPRGDRDRLRPAL